MEDYRGRRSFPNPNRDGRWKYLRPSRGFNSTAAISSMVAYEEKRGHLTAGTLDCALRHSISQIRQIRRNFPPQCSGRVNTTSRQRFSSFQIDSRDSEWKNLNFKPEG